MSGLPRDVRFIERDWLNANHVLLLGAEQNILIDTGFFSQVDETLRRLALPENLGTGRLHRIVNTHCHCDHVGGNAALKSIYACEITVPKGEAEIVRQWDRKGLWLDYADHRGERFVLDSVMHDAERFHGAGLEWRAVAAPGHDMGAMMFYCEEEKLLISGDALWEQSFGLVLPDPPECLAAARAALESIARLEIRHVLPGHGKVFSNVTEALDRAFKRVEYFAQDPERLARHAIKAMFGFTLLDRGRMPLATLPEYLERVPGFAALNAKYLHMSAEELAQWMVSQLEKAGAAKREDGWLVSQ
ncbi:MAG: MBL fold metallo-hydrolase [Burkholderiales bacterium]